MKVALISLNAKYIHTNLAIRYLAGAVQKQGHDAWVFDFSIHDLPFAMAKAISSVQPDLIGLSLYLWNRSETLRLIRILKRVLPDSYVLLGGPEVLADPESIMVDTPEIDGILSGEGERSFTELIHAIHHRTGLSIVPNLVWRDNQTIQRNASWPPLPCMDDIPFPYKHEIWDPNRIYYYESSRGCPFSCTFCMSSLEKSIRYLSWERVQLDLAVLLKAKVRIVKFVDRTFNCDPERALQIWRYLVEHYTTQTVFHFEIAADLLDEKIICFLATVPSGYFQFEIGVQSTNPTTLDAVERKTDLHKIFQNVRILKAAGNIHLHLDLIVGLPYEDLSSFQKSFNQVYSVGAHMVQIGFLKVLPGTQIHAEAAEGDYSFMPDPPYQVLSNRWLSFLDVCQLTDFTHVFDIYGNSGRFEYSLKLLHAETGDAFTLFTQLAEFWHICGLTVHGTGLQTHFDMLARFAQDRSGQVFEEFIEALRFDYCLTGKPTYQPDWYIEREPVSGKMKQRWMEKLLPIILPHLVGESAAFVRRNTEFIYFSYNWIKGQPERSLYLFDYSRKNLNGQAIWTIVDPLYVQEESAPDAEREV
jgi:radical SAM superfamily enzyme YgiQ (UPF0313 family)